MSECQCGRPDLNSQSGAAAPGVPMPSSAVRNLTDEAIRDIADAARDAMQDDFPTTRHEGAARFARLCTPVAVLALIDRAERAERLSPAALREALGEHLATEAADFAAIPSHFAVDLRDKANILTGIRSCLAALDLFTWRHRTV